MGAGPADAADAAYTAGDVGDPSTVTRLSDAMAWQPEEPGMCAEEDEAQAEEDGDPDGSRDKGAKWKNLAEDYPKRADEIAQAAQAVRDSHQAKLDREAAEAAAAQATATPTAEPDGGA